MIEWASEPPPVVKGVPVYQRPVWVPWDQGLKDGEKGISLDNCDDLDILVLACATLREIPMISTVRVPQVA